jgi:hypothetical protein
MTARVSAVACMRLFGGDATSRPRGARHPHYLRSPPITRELHHAPLVRRDRFSPARELARQHFIFVIRQKPPNAAHHAPPRTSASDDRQRVGGRVHALVMRRPTPAETRTRRGHVSAERPARSTHASTRDRRITPRITRPPASYPKHDNLRVAGRVHALVRPPKGAGLKPSAHQARAFRRSNARHHSPPHMFR